MSKAIAVNGSPRKNANTAVLLQKALDGAASTGAEAELIHLFDLQYKTFYLQEQSPQSASAACRLCTLCA